MNKKTIALVAHDNRKKDLIQWISKNRKSLKKYKLTCTGTTGLLVEKEMKKEYEDLKVTCLKSGPLGGDQQMGALIVDGGVDMMIFLWDPMSSQPHDVDIKALLRIAVVYNIPIACNRSTADFIISSPLLEQNYQPIIKDYSVYINRDLE